MEEKITVDFVKKWIEKHHLTKNSYETVLSDTLTNNGHYYIDNPYLRDWIKENKTIFRDLLPNDLNENQQIVLEWLKKKYKTTDIEPIELIWRLRVNSNSDRWRLQPPYKNYRYLTEIAQFQVLAAFAEWGMKEVAE